MKSIRIFFNRLFKCSKYKHETVNNVVSIDEHEKTVNTILEKPIDTFDLNVTPKISSYNILKEAYNSNISNTSYNLIYPIGNNSKSNSPTFRRISGIELIKKNLSKDIKEVPKSCTLEKYKISEANIIDQDGHHNECIVLEHDIDEHIIDTLNTIKNDTLGLTKSYEKKIKIIEKDNIELKKRNDILEKELDKLRIEFLHICGC